jgi:hypothetical protein
MERKIYSGYMDKHGVSGPFCDDKLKVIDVSHRSCLHTGGDTRRGPRHASHYLSLGRDPVLDVRILT